MGHCYDKQLCQERCQECCESETEQDLANPAYSFRPSDETGYVNVGKMVQIETQPVITTRFGNVVEYELPEEFQGFHEEVKNAAKALQPVGDGFDTNTFARIKFVAVGLDRVLYPDGMGNSFTDATPEAREDFEKNVQAFWDITDNGGIAVPVTANTPVLAQMKIDRSLVAWNVQDHPGVFCNGALVLGVDGAVEYSAPVPVILIERLQAWVAGCNGMFKFGGSIHPFAVNLMTKGDVLYLPPQMKNVESQQIAEEWASSQSITNEIADSRFDWRNTPVYQVNLLTKKSQHSLKDDPEKDVDSSIRNIQTALLDSFESNYGKLDLAGCEARHVEATWAETRIVTCGIDKGQSLNRLIHSKSVKERLGEVDVGSNVMVAGESIDDLPLFLEWNEVKDFNGEALKKTPRPALRIIMPHSEDERLLQESNLRNTVPEVIAAIMKQLRFEEKLSMYSIQPYSEVYGLHPRDFDFFAGDDGEQVEIGSPDYGDPADTRNTFVL